ncbi:MAG: MarR family transcriptional regulator, partial [Pseudomonadota bacterium]
LMSKDFERSLQSEGTNLRTNDLIDRLVEDWRHERPDFDLSGMAVVGRIIHLASRLKVRAGGALKNYSLHYTEFDVLATLRRSGEPYQLTPTQLMESVLITSGAMTATLKRLEDRSLIERSDDPHDKRVRRVRLTKTGLALIDRAAPVRFEEASSAISGLNSEQTTLLSDLLHILLEDLSDNPD